MVIAAILAPSLMGNAYYIAAGVVILNWAVCATGWNLMGGLTGYISFGHAAFWGLGAYGTAILLNATEIPSFVAMTIGVLLVSLIALPVGLAALRARGDSFVIVTLAFTMICLLVFQSWRSLTGGSNGLFVDRPFPDLSRPEHHERFYYLYLLLLAATLLIWWLVERSRFGMGLKAIQEDEDKAESLGVPTTGYKLTAFILSAATTAAAGGMYALWFGDLDPVFQFSVLFSATLLLMALVGGVRSLFGPTLGALVVGVGLEFFKLNYGDTQFHLVLTGGLLVIVVLLMPDGIIPAFAALGKRYAKREDVSIREISAEDLLRLSDKPPVSRAASDKDTFVHIPVSTRWNWVSP